MSRRKGQDKYKPEYDAQLINFFETKRKEHMPAWFDDFADVIGVVDDTLQHWTKSHPSFLCAYTRCKKLQEQIMADNAMTGKFEGGFTKFAMKNVVGWRDEKDLNLGGQANNPLDIEITFVNKTKEND
jgi:hypothetical protein